VGETRVRVRVQMRKLGEYGWRTPYTGFNEDEAMRCAERLRDEETYSKFRVYAYVRVLRGDDIVAAWSHGRPMVVAQTRGVA
jgi:hypothetical protein